MNPGSWSKKARDQGAKRYLEAYENSTTKGLVGYETLTIWLEKRRVAKSHIRIAKLPSFGSEPTLHYDCRIVLNNILAECMSFFSRGMRFTHLNSDSIYVHPSRLQVRIQSNITKGNDPNDFFRNLVQDLQTFILQFIENDDHPRPKDVDALIQHIGTRQINNFNPRFIVEHPSLYRPGTLFEVVRELYRYIAAHQGSLYSIPLGTMQPNIVLGYASLTGWGEGFWQRARGCKIMQDVYDEMYNKLQHTPNPIANHHYLSFMEFMMQAYTHCSTFQAQHDRIDPFVVEDYLYVLSPLYMIRLLESIVDNNIVEVEDIWNT